MLTAGPQAQAEAGPVHEDPCREEEQDGDGGRQIEIFENQGIQKAVARRQAEGGLGDPDPVGDLDGGQALSLYSPGHNDGEGRGKGVQGSTADGLVRLEVDGREGQQQGEDHAG